LRAKAVWGVSDLTHSAGLFRPERELYFSPDPALSSEADLDLYIARRFLPWRHDGRRLLIAVSYITPATVAWLRARYGRVRVVPIGTAELNGAIARRFRLGLSRRAVYALDKSKPELSARRVFSRSQATIAFCLALAAAAALTIAPVTAIMLLIVVAAAGFVLSIAMRCTLVVCDPPRRRPPPALGDADLPVYTVLIPLYREGEILPQLVEALSAFDYPRDKLDVKLIVEEDDGETRSAAERLSRGRFEIVVVPRSLPRTKPKALNFALPFARGELLAIYDAEDRPEADQLRKAAAAFRTASAETVCLQARLTIDNADECWLSSLFAVDYDIWFRSLLPGLNCLGLPMPLGGTSNHFRTDALRRAMGWDAFNVTEDADLGIRLARLGGRVAMLDSTTFEAAPARFVPWFKQRTRWLKGYMQTSLVHLRDPAGLSAAMGLRGSAAVFFFFGGTIWSALVNPLLWLIFVFFALDRPVPVAGPVNTIAIVSGLGLTVANLALAGMAAVSRRERKNLRLAFDSLGYVLYWMLISAAAWRSVWQLIFRPHFWEKTPHGRKV